MEQTETLELWTVQRDIVMDTLEQQGVYFVKKDYVRQKYGQTAWIFCTAYDFFVKTAAQKMPKPEQAEYPVWLYQDARQPFRAKGDCLLRVAVPRSEVLLFDCRNWSKVLNLSFLGTQQQTREFQLELESLAIQHPADVFQTPFYPLQKRKILKSWEGLLEQQLPPAPYVQGAAWLLRREWVQEVTRL